MVRIMSKIKRVPLSRAGAELGEFVAKPVGPPMALTQRGKIVAVVYRCDSEDDIVHLSWEKSPRLCEIIEQAEEDLRQGKGIPHDEFWKLVEADTKARAAKKARKTTKAKVRA